MSRKVVDMSKLSATNSGASLVEREGDSTAKKGKIIYLPIAFEERHKALKESGTTSLAYSNYIAEALREKLDRDEQRS